MWICCGSILSLVQILFPLFQTLYNQITITKTKEIKFEPRIKKLNHNRYIIFLSTHFVCKPKKKAPISLYISLVCFQNILKFIVVASTRGFVIESLGVLCSWAACACSKREKSRKVVVDQSVRRSVSSKSVPS